MILEILLMHVAWLIPYLRANSSTSMLVTLTTWWIVLISGLLWVWIWAIDVATLFLMLTSDAMMATDEDEEDSKTISSSNWAHDLSSFSLLNKLEEMWSEKLSITLRPGENSKFKGLKIGKYSLTLLAESTKWPLTRDYCLLVRESRATASRSELELSCELISDQIRWLWGSLQVRS